MIAAVVLAAGASRRLGQRKQLLPTAEGPLLRAMASRVCAARGVDAVGVVLGAHAEEIAPSLEGLAVRVLANDAWSEGMGSSVRVAARWATELRADALLVVVCDQSELTSAHLEALVAAAAGGRTAGSGYAGTVGVPAIFPASSFAALAALAGDRGARDLLRTESVVVVPWEAGERDVDTAADVRAMPISSSRRL